VDEWDDEDSEGDDEEPERCPICSKSYDPGQGEEGLPSCGHLLAHEDNMVGFDGPVRGTGEDLFPPLSEEESPDADERIRTAFGPDVELAAAIYSDSWTEYGQLEPLYEYVGRRHGLIREGFSGTSSMAWDASFWFCADVAAASADLLETSRRLTKAISLLQHETI
jgi:hypothetical protein